MGQLDTDVYLRASRGLPQGFPDTQEVPARGGRYGSFMAESIVPTKHVLADEGSYYVGTSAVPGTAIAENAVSTAFSDTRGFFVFWNTEQASNNQAKRVFLDYIKLLLSGTAPTATTVMHFALKRSTISREASAAANRTIVTPVNMASGSGRQSICRVTVYNAAGAMTIPGANQSDPVVGRCSLPTSLGITGDEYILKFGGEDVGMVPGLTAVRAAAPARIVATLPPIVIEPGESIVLHRWWLTEATNAPSCEYEFGLWER